MPGPRIANVDAGDAVGLGGGCYQILAESRDWRRPSDRELTGPPGSSAAEQHIVRRCKWKGERHARAPSFIAAAACASPAPWSRATRRRAPTSCSCRTRPRSGFTPGARCRASAAAAARCWRRSVTLALLGPAGERLKAHALPAGYGRPFSLGELRLEMFPSGLHAGRRVAAVRARRAARSCTPGQSAPTPAEVRAADALCIDATLRQPGADVSRARAGAGGRRARRARRARPRGGAPVVLVDPLAIALDVAAALAADRIGLCAHRAIVQAAAAYRDAGLPAPALQRFAAKIGPGEALLWPAPVRVPPRRAGARAPGVIWSSADAGARRGGRPPIATARGSCFRPRPTSPASCATSRRAAPPRSPWSTPPATT